MDLRSLWRHYCPILWFRRRAAAKMDRQHRQLPTGGVLIEGLICGANPNFKPFPEAQPKPQPSREHNGRYNDGQLAFLGVGTEPVGQFHFGSNIPQVFDGGTVHHAAYGGRGYRGKYRGRSASRCRYRERRKASVKSL